MQSKPTSLVFNARIIKKAQDFRKAEFFFEEENTLKLLFIASSINSRARVKLEEKCFKKGFYIQTLGGITLKKTIYKKYPYIMKVLSLFQGSCLLVSPQESNLSFEKFFGESKEVLDEWLITNEEGGMDERPFIFYGGILNKRFFLPREIKLMTIRNKTNLNTRMVEVLIGSSTCLTSISFLPEINLEFLYFLDFYKFGFISLIEILEDSR